VVGGFESLDPSTIWRTWSILFLGEFPQGSSIVWVLSEATPDAIPEAVENSLALILSCGLLKMPDRVGRMPQVP
jgi:hypothetical protein